MRKGALLGELLRERRCMNTSHGFGFNEDDDDDDENDENDDDDDDDEAAIAVAANADVNGVSMCCWSLESLATLNVGVVEMAASVPTADIAPPSIVDCVWDSISMPYHFTTKISMPEF